MLFQKLLNRVVRFRLYNTTDVFFIGYPKVGNTWIRFLVGRYFQLECSSEKLFLFDGMDRFWRCEKACIGPAIHFTHAPLEWDKQTANDLDLDLVVKPFRNKKVVLLVRHPLDTLVSFWFDLKHKGAKSYLGDLRTLLENETLGLQKHTRFSNIWAGVRHEVKDIMLLRYEDLLSDTKNGFVSVMRFLGVEPEQLVANDAIDYCSFNNMQELERQKKDFYYKSGLRVLPTGNSGDRNSFHVRRGKVEGFKDLLSVKECEDYENVISKTLDEWYGYPFKT